MKALLLAAGLGTRLRPITDKIPKCLVEIQGTPLLQLWIEKLQDLKVSEIIINTHYLRNKVENTNPTDVLNGNIDQFIEAGIINK